MNRLANYVCMAAGFAILVFTISALTPGSALAQIVKAALVKNVDEKGRVPYSFTQFCINNTDNVCVVTTSALMCSITSLLLFGTAAVVTTQELPALVKQNCVKL